MKCKKCGKGTVYMNKKGEFYCDCNTNLKECTTPQLFSELLKRLSDREIILELATVNQVRAKKVEIMNGCHVNEKREIVKDTNGELKED